MPRMNHDYAHCANYNEKTCPKSCFRGQLIRDLMPGDIVAWSNLRNTDLCELNKPTWVRKTKDGYYWMECPNCKKRPLERYGMTFLSPYCPWCGKKLNGEEI